MTYYFRSLIAFGTVCVVTDDAEKLETIHKLWKRYTPEYEDAAQKYIRDRWKIFSMIEFKIEHLTGKQAIELVQGKKMRE